EKHRQPAGGIFSRDENGVALSLAQFVRDLAEKLKLQLGIPAKHFCKRLAWNLIERNFRNGLYRVDGPTVFGQPEHVARKQKQRHPTFSAGHFAEGLQHTFLRDEDRRKFSVLPIDDRTRREGHECRQRRETTSLRFGQQACGGALCILLEFDAANHRSGIGINQLWVTMSRHDRTPILPIVGPNRVPGDRRASASSAPRHAGCRGTLDVADVHSEVASETVLRRARLLAWLCRRMA